MATDQNNRKIEILKIISKYKLFKYARKAFKNKEDESIQSEFGIRLRKSLEELGPTFVKFGQMLSVRRDIFHINVVKELEKLQDNVKAVSFEEIKEVLKEEYEDIPFSSIDSGYLATGSIAQVHTAKISDGSLVAIKVQRKGIEEIIKKDLAILREIAFLLDKTKYSEYVGFKEFISEFSDQIFEELNFNKEVNNILEFEKLNKNDKYVSVPKVYKDLSTNRCIVMEYIGDYSMKYVIDHKEDFDREEISNRLLYSYANQVFKDGYYHADPHPGNIMVDDEKNITFIDFGIVGNVSTKIKYGLLKLFYGVSKNHTRLIIESLRELKIIDSKVNLKEFEDDISGILDRYLYYSLNEIRIEEVFDLFFTILRKYDIKLPSDIYILIKTFIHLESIIESLEIEKNLLEIVVPIAERLRTSFISFDYISQYLSPAIYDTVMFGLEAPSFLTDFIRKFKDNGYVLDYELSSSKEEIERENKKEKTKIKLVLLFISSIFFITSFIIYNFGNKGTMLAIILMILSSIGVVVSFFSLMKRYFEMEKD